MININVYALYSNKVSISNNFKTENYKIVLDSNGGIFNEEAKMELYENGEIGLPHPEKKGYTFKKYKAKNNLQISEPIKSLDYINNKDLIAEYEINTYNIDLNLDGGEIKNKYNKYTIEDRIEIEKPVKDNYIFEGWKECNGEEIKKELIIEEGTIGDLCYIANWKEEKYEVWIISNVDDKDYEEGLEEYIYDVWIDDILVAENTTSWKETVKKGSKVRVKTKEIEGRTTNYDETFKIYDNTIIRPKWNVNTYESQFYCRNYYSYSLNYKYGTKVEYLPIGIEHFGYNTNFYYFNGFVPRDSWYQKAYTMRFDAIVEEYNCMASFGSSTLNNAYNQLNRLNSVGYNMCIVNPSWNALECYGKSSAILNLYDNSWNVLPRSGNGYSVYKQMSCDSGYSTYNYR